MRAAIITFHRAYNCGAMLQAYALQTVLSSLGHEASFPDCNMVGAQSRFNRFTSKRQGFRRFLSFLRFLKVELFSLGPVDLRRLLFARFYKKWLKVVACPYSEIATRYDVAAFGSDQIWNPDCIGKDKENEVGIFLGEGLMLPKIAFAASVGDRMLDSSVLARVQRAVATFNAVSVREQFACAVFQDRQKRTAELVLDPTLLLQREEWEKAASPKKAKKKFILCYTLGPHKQTLERLKKASVYLGMPFVILDLYRRGHNGEGYDSKIAFGPAEFLGMYRDCSAVVANSFHATAFAAIFNKPFVSIRDKEEIPDVDSRQAAFLKLLGVPERLVTPSSRDEDWLPLLKTSLAKSSFDKLEAARKGSLDWLKAALDEVVVERGSAS